LLQGVTAGYHRVGLTFNGSPAGEVLFADQQQGALSAPVLAAALRAGQNTVTLTSEGGAQDVSLVASLRLTYPHTYAASGDQLRCLAPGGSTLRVSGFTSPDLRIADVA